MLIGMKSSTWMFTNSEKRSLVFNLCNQDVCFPVSSTNSCLEDKAALALSKYYFVKQSKGSRSKVWRRLHLKWLHLFHFHISPFWLRSFLESIFDQPLESNTGQLLKASFICHWEGLFPVYHVPCWRESGFRRPFRPHLNNMSTRTEEGLTVMFL